MSRPGQRQRTVSIGGGESRQAETIIAGIIIAAALLIGFFIIDALEDATPATEENEVVNETFSVTFDSNDVEFYTVDDEGIDANEGFQDDESVFNNTDAQLVEGTDYEWFPANGTVKVINTSPNGVTNNTDANITYSYDTHIDGFEDTVDRIGDGLLIGGVLIIVLFAAIILRVLRGL